MVSKFYWASSINLNPNICACVCVCVRVSRCRACVCVQCEYCSASSAQANFSFNVCDICTTTRVIHPNLQSPTHFGCCILHSFSDTIYTQHILLQKTVWYTAMEYTCRNTNIFFGIYLYIYTLMQKRYGVLHTYTSIKMRKIGENVDVIFFLNNIQTVQTSCWISFIPKNGKQRKRNGTKVIVYEFHIQWPWHCRTWQQHFFFGRFYVRLCVCMSFLFLLVP